MTGEPLDGEWRATAATESLVRSFMQPDVDVTDWHEAVVPGHWQSLEGLASSDGPVLYRCRFATAPLSEDLRAWLVFEGIHYGSDVWLDGVYLGTTQGYFGPHEFEVTDHLRERSEHDLALEVFASRSSPTDARRDLAGIFDNVEFMGQTRNPGGIWRPVRLLTSGPVRIKSMRVLCTEATPQNASIRCSAKLHSVEPRPIEIVTSLLPPEGGAPITTRTAHHLASGDTIIEWRVGIDDPQLWWPRSLGDQPLYRLQVAAMTAADQGGEPPSDQQTSDLVERSVGIRTVELDGYQLSVNGKRLFVKGASMWPTNTEMADTEPDRIDGDLAMAADLNLDMLRVHTHVAPPEFYDAADQAGMLLWQDVPLDGPVAQGLRSEAIHQAETMVDMLAHHASIAIWCAHNDPTGTSRHPDKASSTFARVRRFALQEAPSWNKSVLDRWVERAMKRADPTRHVIPHSGTWPSPPRLDGTDSHLWFGWSYGMGRDLERFARAMPRMVRWVSAFGAQSVPADAEFCEAHRWPDLNWSNLAGEYGLDRDGMYRYVPPEKYRTFDDWVLATQDYQATVLRRQIETLRRLKYSPTGGFCFMALADSRPCISFAIVDSERRPKSAYDAVRAACAPVIAVADRLPVNLVAGEPLMLDMHVVSDMTTALGPHELSARLCWPTTEDAADVASHTWRWTGAIDADSVLRVGSISWVAADTAGPVSLELELRNIESNQIIATNSYQSTIR